MSRTEYGQLKAGLHLMRWRAGEGDRSLPTSFYVFFVLVLTPRAVWHTLSLPSRDCQRSLLPCLCPKLRMPQAPILARQRLYVAHQCTQSNVDLHTPLNDRSATTIRPMDGWI